MILLQDSGLINRAVLAMGFEKLRLIRTLLGVIIGMTQVLLPFMIMPLYAVMRGIDLRLVQASRSLGHGATDRLGSRLARLVRTWSRIGPNPCRNQPTPIPTAA